jgi:hypothetical protein
VDQWKQDFTGIDSGHFDHEALVTRRFWGNRFSKAKEGTTLTGLRSGCALGEAALLTASRRSCASMLDGSGGLDTAEGQTTPLVRKFVTLVVSFSDIGIRSTSL